MSRRSCLSFLWLLLAIGAVVTQINAPALLAYTPTQRDQGIEVFERRCSTCHGDKGQGLTLEWRQTWPKEDQNCSTPKCHGAQHPSDGFEIKDNYAPAIIGPGTLTRFQMAQDLFNFISTRMPMQAPGTLSQDDYWALTAFLLAAHGVPADEADLNAATASRISLADAMTNVDLSQQPWWREITPAPQPVMPALAEAPSTGFQPSAPHPTSQGPSTEGTAGSTWWLAAAGVGLAMALLALTGYGLRRSRGKGD